MIVLGVEEQSGRPPKESPDPGEAFVIFDGRGKATVLQTGQRLSPGEIRNWGKRKVVRIATAERATTVTTTVTAADGFRQFGVDLSASWRVSDFVRAAGEGSTDIEQLVRTTVAKKASDFHRQFPMDQNGATALYQALCAHMTLEIVEFVTLARIVGRVELDSSVASHFADVQRVVDGADLERQRLQADTELQQFRGKNAAASEQAKIDVERMRNGFELELAKERAKADVEILQTKLALYSQLAQGMPGLISLQLAQDPSQIDVVIQGVREHQLVNARLNLDAVRALVEADSVEGFDLSEVAKRTLGSFLQLATGSIAGDAFGPLPAVAAGSGTAGAADSDKDASSSQGTSS